MNHIGDEFQCAVLEGILLIMRQLLITNDKESWKNKQRIMEYIEEVQKAII